MVWLTPTNLPPGDEDAERRARLVILFAGVGGAGSAVALLVAALIGSVSAGSFMAFPACVASVIVARRFGRTSLAANLTLGGGWLALVLSGPASGGIDSSALGFYGLLVIGGVLTAGRRSGRFWAIAGTVTLVVFYVADARGVDFPADEAFTSAENSLLLAILFIAMLYLVGSLFETNVDRMLTRIAAATEELAAARDQAEIAHREARLVLDHVEEGFLVVDGDGRPAGQWSAFAVDLLGDPTSGRRLWELFAPQAPQVAAFLELGWEMLFEGIMPVGVTMAQLPRECQLGDRHLRLTYTPLRGDDGRLTQVLVVITDATELIERERSERDRHLQVEAMKWLVRDRTYFVDSFTELGQLQAQVLDRATPPVERSRSLHTLKGNAAVLGFDDLARACHELEDELVDTGRSPLTRRQRRTIGDAWSKTCELVAPLLGDVNRHMMLVPMADIQQVMDRARLDAPEVHELVARWSWESTGLHLQRLAGRAQAIVGHRPEVSLNVVVDDDGVTFPWIEHPHFWSAALHVVRNAIDHGIEPHSERRAAGKRERGTLILRSRQADGELTIDIEDDGRGIDWDRLRQRALELGRPAGDRADLERLLVSDGFTTRDHATELSGRGLGLSAFAAACRAAGGTMSIDSSLGRGTRIRCVLPAPVAIAVG